jgi:hypothetical protein
MTPVLAAVMAADAVIFAAIGAYLVRLVRQPAPPPTRFEWELPAPEGTA